MVLQTFRPGHYSLQAAIRHDYPTFYRAEIRTREELGYPLSPPWRTWSSPSADEERQERRARKRRPCA